MKFAILTSGGDAPGMNAAIHGAVSRAQQLGHAVVGFVDGYEGLMANHQWPLTEALTRQHLNKGGTFIGSARSERFKEPEVQEYVAKRLQADGFDGLIVIGGDGSYQGALKLESHGLPVVAIPGTIDNDIPCTEATLGFKTSARNIVETVDIIMQSAESHRHLYGIEVMGRRAGDLAIWAGEALDADGIIAHREDFDAQACVEIIDASVAQGNRSQLFIIAEGAMTCHEFREAIESISDYSIHPLMLGHIQRGGNPVLEDRILGQYFGEVAIDQLVAGQTGVNLAVVDGRVVAQDIRATLASTKQEIYPFHFREDA